MPMELDRRELKAQARERLRAASPPFWLVTLVYLLLTAGLTTAANLTGAAYIAVTPGEEDTVPLFLALLLLLFTLVMRFGYRVWALETYRRQQPDLWTLINGFSFAGRVIVMELYITVYTAIWSFLLVFPFCLVVMSVTPPMVGFLGLSLTLPPLLSLVALLVSYRYALAPYRLMDRPELGPFVPVRESVAMMRGWKWQFFKLDLSFLGWILVNFILGQAVQLPFLISTMQELLQAETVPWDLIFYGPELPWGAVVLASLVQVPISLWLTPYRAVAHAGFYQARVEQPASSSSVWGPYGGPYQGPEL